MVNNRKVKLLLEKILRELEIQKRRGAAWRSGISIKIRKSKINKQKLP